MSRTRTQNPNLNVSLYPKEPKLIFYESKQDYGVIWADGSKSKQSVNDYKVNHPDLVERWDHTRNWIFAFFRYLKQLQSATSFGGQIGETDLLGLIKWVNAVYIKITWRKPADLAPELAKNIETLAEKVEELWQVIVDLYPDLTSDILTDVSDEKSQWQQWPWPDENGNLSTISTSLVKYDATETAVVPVNAVMEDISAANQLVVANQEVVALRQQVNAERSNYQQQVVLAQEKAVQQYRLAVEAKNLQLVRDISLRMDNLQQEKSAYLAQLEQTAEANTQLQVYNANANSKLAQLQQELASQNAVIEANKQRALTIINVKDAVENDLSQALVRVQDIDSKFQNSRRLAQEMADEIARKNQAIIQLEVEVQNSETRIRQIQSSTELITREAEEKQLQLIEDENNQLILYTNQREALEQKFNNQLELNQQLLNEKTALVTELEATKMRADAAQGMVVESQWLATVDENKSLQLDNLANRSVIGSLQKQVATLLQGLNEPSQLLLTDTSLRIERDALNEKVQELETRLMRRDAGTIVPSGSVSLDKFTELERKFEDAREEIKLLQIIDKNLKGTVELNKESLAEALTTFNPTSGNRALQEENKLLREKLQVAQTALMVQSPKQVVPYTLPVYPTVNFDIPSTQLALTQSTDVVQYQQDVQSLRTQLAIENQEKELLKIENNRLRNVTPSTALATSNDSQRVRQLEGVIANYKTALELFKATKDEKVLMDWIPTPGQTVIQRRRSLDSGSPMELVSVNFPTTVQSNVSVDQALLAAANLQIADLKRQITVLQHTRKITGSTKPLATTGLNQQVLRFLSVIAG